METPVIEVSHLGHRYGKKSIYEDLSFIVPPGKIYALLGKNGVGKTTLIKILMGFLRPFSGECKVFGEPSHALSPRTRAKIGLLFEGHLAYEFMSIGQIEKFYAAFYPQWEEDVYFHMVDKLGLPHSHLIKNMSCGQRSQVVLGLIMAQQPHLLLLDDYSIGLDAGYRRLFLDDMREYLDKGQRTVFVTSHVIQDMVGFVEEVIFLERGGQLLTTSLEEFQNTFHCYRMFHDGNLASLPAWDSQLIKNVEYHEKFLDIFSFADFDQVGSHIKDLGVVGFDFEKIPMSLEDAFIGYTGRY